MTWQLTTTQKDSFLELMNELGAHSMYRIPLMVKELSECGIPVFEDKENECLVIDGVKVHLATPEWGDPGVYPPHVLSVVIDHFGYEITSEMSGLGFRFKDKLQQLAGQWGIDKTYI